MNVTGVGATPPPQPVPPIAPATAAASTEAEPGPREGEPGSGRGRRPGDRRSEVALPEAPPLRMLTITEMRVMLGQLPASAALRSPHGEVEVREAYS
jgi:hypothetical protein